MKSQLFIALALMVSANSAWSLSCDPESRSCVNRDADAVVANADAKVTTSCRALAEGNLTDIDPQFRPDGTGRRSRNQREQGTVE